MLAGFCAWWALCRLPGRGWALRTHPAWDRQGRDRQGATLSHHSRPSGQWAGRRQHQGLRSSMVCQQCRRAMPHHAGSSSAAIKLRRPPWLQEPPGEGTHLATGLRVPPGGWGGVGGVLELQHQPASLHLSILGEQEGAEQRQGQGEGRRGLSPGQAPPHSTPGTACPLSSGP